MSAAVVLRDAVVVLTIFFLVINSFQALLLMFAVPELWSDWQLSDDDYFRELVGSDALPPVSVVATLAPGSASIRGAARMLLDLDYPHHEVLLVTDGSEGVVSSLAALELYEIPPAFAVTLKTQRVRAYYRSRAEPRLIVVDKVAGGAGDALNAGINAARYPYVLSVGADVSLYRDALLRLTRPFLLDRAVVATAAALRPVYGTARGWVSGSQTVEYLRSFLFQRLGWNRVASNLIFPGNASLFRREDVFGVGGFDPEAAIPDLDLAVRLHRHLADLGVNPRMTVIPDDVGSTRLPDNLHDISVVRRRWELELVKALKVGAGMTGNPEYGAFGLIAIPYFWLAVVVLPFAELIGYALVVLILLFDRHDSVAAVAYLAAVIGYGMLLSVWTVVIHALTVRRADSRGETSRLLYYAIAESLGFRQVMAWIRASSFFGDRSTSPTNG